jgi:DNA polymerase-3 subunit gamma/tau
MPEKSEPKAAVKDQVKAELKVESRPAPAKPAQVKVESSKAQEVKPTEVSEKSIKQSGSIEISALRRMWPEVIESVKKRRRLTWSLLSTSAQILSLDDEVITIGMVNIGAKDSFIRSESDVILSDAFEEVTGVRRRIAATVDISITATTMAQNDEDLSDTNMLSGAELLASKLGAKVIKESN